MNKKIYSAIFQAAFLLLGCLVLSSADIYAQADTAFWFAAPYIAKDGWNGRLADRPVVLRITALDQAAKVTIQQPAGGGMPSQTIPVPVINTTKSVDVTPWVSNIENHPANTLLNYGIKITSDVPVIAYYQVESFISAGTPSPPDSRCSPEIFNLKGGLALGKEFTIPSQFHYRNDTVSSSLEDARNAFLIVATENNTTVTITPSHAIVGHAAGLPFTVQLNDGQTYAAVALYATPGSHLQGSHVTADKPVAITVSDDHVEIAGGDLAGDQIVPTSILGKEYVVLNGKLDSGNVPVGTVQDNIFITATENAAQVSINGNNAAILNAGESYSFGLGRSDAAYVTADHPVSVWHISGVSGQAGASEAPRLNCAGSQSVAFLRTLVGPLLLNIVVPQGGEGGFTLNGNTGIITGNLFAPVPGINGQWLYCRLDVNDLLATVYPYESIIKIENQSARFQLSVVNGCKNPTLYWGANLSYFSGYAAAGGNILGPDTSLCLGNSMILDVTTNGATGYQWSTGATTAAISIDTPGTYWVHLEGDFCVQNDTIHVGLRQIPPVDLGNDTTICAGKKIVLSTSLSSGASALWNTGAISTSIIVQDSGTYWVKVSYPACDDMSDTVAVGLMHCDCFIGVPNVFSPDGDGQNDVFLPVIGAGCPIQYYDMRIYNRYGQLVFESRDPEIGWNGKQAREES
ncbi:MAG TPA: gliding motility-associated C-terminal domain-containing protein [Edaphocola sp.]|nr:gliding motility-associated C-terminal domain-containing protein [Edaphocola sp.]